MTPDNIKLPNEDIELLSFSLEGSSLLLCFNRNLELNKTYTLIVNHFSDTIGNANDSIIEKDFIFLDNQAPEALSISVITPYSIAILFSESIDYERTKPKIFIYLPDLEYMSLVEEGEKYRRIIC